MLFRWSSAGIRGRWSRIHDVRLSTGQRLLVPQDMHWSFSEGSYYEKNVEYWLVRLASNMENCIFYDIGANLGYYAVLLAPWTRKTFAFEPSPRTTGILRTNVNRNKLSERIEILALGISDYDGFGDLHLYTSIGNNSLHERKIPDGHALRHVGIETVPIASLDSARATNKLEAPDLIKIDIEGGELSALRGAEQTLRDCSPIVLFEYSETTARDAGYKRRALLDFLEPLGYQFFGLSSDPGDPSLKVLGPPNPLIDNIIAVPKRHSVLVAELLLDS